ncbi:hypothetical protein GOBAR_AA32829 [Gossypium barbadense]|uniref:Uncharacterized protein n=1 Tax=Gossypium barbadense TaxID=3634 RepID=A0A2P5W9V8_GOSBA|nr:hypothetical protein GOBAR_AA32829 [Gossypium barbadense]
MELNYLKNKFISAVNNVDFKIYNEIIKNDENSKSKSQVEVVYQDKEIISESNIDTVNSEEIVMEPESGSDSEMNNLSVYRSKSEKLAIRKCEEEVMKNFDDWRQKSVRKLKTLMRD